MLFCCIPSCVPYTSAATPLSPKGALVLARLGGLQVWTLGLRLSWDNPGKGPDGGPLIWVRAWHCAPVLLWACGGGPLVG